MKLYEVTSEEICIKPTGGELMRSGKIYRVVAARNRSQARYLAWESDQGQQSFQTFNRGDITKMPRFRVRKLADNLKLRVGDLTLS